MWPTRSLAPVFGAAHSGGGDGADRRVQTVLWFQPEMNLNSSCDCMPGFGKVCVAPCGAAESTPSFLAEHHPDWLAWDGATGPLRTSLVDLSLPDAREWVVTYLTDAIEAWGVDTFRIESSCNGGHDCLSFFQQHDRTAQRARHPSVPRSGATEIGHTNGLHTVFDELRRRVPSLVIDVCAGGGRKIDLDIMARGIQKWQSDYTGAADDRQGHLMGEQHYQPLSAAGLSSSDPYEWRSVATTGGLIFWDQTADDDATRARTAAAVAETMRLRGVVLGGDFFHLTNLDRYGWSDVTGDAGSWAAWQWANATRNNGAALFFRRSAAAATVMVALNYVDPAAEYYVDYSYNYSVAKTERRQGADLIRLVVALSFPPGVRCASLLLEYRRALG